MTETSVENNLYGRMGSKGYYKHYPSFLRLFRYEFDALLDNQQFASQLKDNISSYMRPKPERGTMLYDLLESEDTIFDDEGKERLFKALRKISDKKTEFWSWYHELLIWYTDTNSKNEMHDDANLHDMLHNLPTTDAEHFQKFFDPNEPLKLDIIADLLLPKPLFSAFEATGPDVYKNLLEDIVVPRWHEYKHDFYYGIAEFLRRLFYCVPGRYNEKDHSWYMDFLTACRKNVGNGTLVSFIDPHYHNDLRFYTVKLKAENRELASISNEDYVTEEMARSARFRQPQDYILNNPIFSMVEDAPSAIELRGYQRELARHATAGENTIICAQTGSGKTIVAVEIIRNHLETNNVNPDGTVVQRSRVAFVVPTVPLVDQQCSVIKNYLDISIRVTGLSGADNNDMNVRSYDILQSHVIVITPQMLVNLLQNVNKNRRLYVADFSLFVLDECHHCGAKHPYEIMMKLVRQYTDETNKYKLDRHIPQVVGLTASLGADSSVYVMEKTQNRILDLCARMLATQLSTVRTESNIQELKRYVNSPIDRIYRCNRPRDDPFHYRICAMMTRIVAMLKPCIEKIAKFCEFLKDFKFPKVDELSFCAAIDRLKDSRKKWPDQLNEEKLLVSDACDQLKVYAKVIQTNDLLPACYAYKTMETKFAEFFATPQRSSLFREIFDENNSQLNELQQQDRGESKEILKHLKHIIQTEYSTNSDTRTLIFVETRNLASYLSEYLNFSEALKEFRNSYGRLAAYLTSTNAAQKAGGLSPAEQRELLQMFDQGDIKILVVTSVAEEGLDISACNLIIKYNTVDSERSMIQRRGRARSLDSKSFLVCLDENVEQRELTNIIREQNMLLCLQDLQSKSPDQLKALIMERRALMHETEKRAAAEKKRLADAIEKKLYDIQCNTCQRTFCKSDQVRIVLDSHFCGVNPKIWNSIEIGYGGRSSAEQNIIVCAPFRCKNCKSTLGNVIKYADVFLPSIKHTSIALQEAETIIKTTSRDTDRITQHKWNEIQEKYFVVEPISVETLVGLYRTLAQDHSEDLVQLQLHADFAVQHQLEKLNERRMRKIRHRLNEDGY